MKSNINEIRFNGINFSAYTENNQPTTSTSTPVGYNFMEWSGTGIDLSFFPSFNKTEPVVVSGHVEVIVPDDEVRNKELFGFFVLVQKLKVTLSVSGPYGPFNPYQHSDLMQSLVKTFNQKKIKKIVFKGGSNFKEYMELIADEVIIY